MAAAARKRQRGGKKHARATQGFPKGFFGWTSLRQRAWLKSPEANAAVARGILLRVDVEQALRGANRAIEKYTNRIRTLSPTWERAEEWERTGVPFPPPADTENCRMRRADRVLNVGHERKTFWPATYLTSHTETLLEQDEQTGKPVVVRERECDLTYDKVVYEDYMARKRLGLDDHDDRHVDADVMAARAGELEAVTVEGVPTREAAERLESMNAIIVEGKPLKSEDEATLRRQIARYNAGLRTNLMLADGERVEEKLKSRGPNGGDRPNRPG